MIEFYRDRRREWRWRIRATNHRIVAVASEGYRDRKEAVEGAVIAADVLDSWDGQ